MSKKQQSDEQEQEPVQEVRSYRENGKLIILSPLADYPGTIEIEYNLDPATIVEIFKRMENPPDFYKQQGIPSQFKEFYTKFPMFEFKIPGINPSSWDLENGTGFPAALAVRCTTESSTLLKEALDLKN
jgi:hypothetical protein